MTEALQSAINETLGELFRSHEVIPVLQDGWLVFPDVGIRAMASIGRHGNNQNGLWLQLDVQIEIPSGQLLVESFVGFGITIKECVFSALQNFAVNSLHVILAVFFATHRDRVTQQRWSIGSQTRVVTIGEVGVRGVLPGKGRWLTDTLDQFFGKIKQSDFSTGIHWIRLFYAQMQRETTALEVLLDNVTWELIQKDMANVHWPMQKDFYSIRIFLIISDK